MRSESTKRAGMRAFVSDLRRTVLSHRRLLAALCAFVAVASSLQVLRPDPPETVTVVVAARDLAAGRRLSPADLTTAELPPDVSPQAALTGVRSARGQTLAAPVRSGEVMTDRRLVQPSLLEGYPPGSMLASIRVTDAASLTGVRVGDRVNVVASDARGEAPPRTLARGTPVAAIPDLDGKDVRAVDGVVVMLAVPEETALELAASQVRDRLAVVVSGDLAPAGSGSGSGSGPGR